MEFIKKEVDGEMIELAKIKEGDIVSLCFEDREDLDISEFLDDFKGDLIVECVDYESELFWIKDCDYAINIDWISSVKNSYDEHSDDNSKDELWIITTVNNYSFSYPEMNTRWARNYNEALSYFKFFVDKYVAAEKEYFAERFNVEADLSLSEYRTIAAQNGESLSYGYSTTEYEKIFTIEKVHMDNSDTEEFVIRMYKLDSGKTDFSTLVTLDHNDNIDTIINNIKCF